MVSLILIVLALIDSNLKKNLTLNKEQELYTQVPLLVKIYKLLINEMHGLMEEKKGKINISNQKLNRIIISNWYYIEEDQQGEEDYEEEEEEGAEDEEDGDELDEDKVKHFNWIFDSNSLTTL